MDQPATAKALKIDCVSGISGDMLVSAFHDLLENAGMDASALASVIHAIKESMANVSSIDVQFQHVAKNGFVATHMNLDIQESETENHGDVAKIEENLERCMAAAGIVNPRARAFASTALEILVDAEAKVHGILHDHDARTAGRDGNGSLDHGHVHLHELASADTIVDILVVTKALDMLGFFAEPPAFAVHAGPVSTGRGKIKIAHGIVPVPAPGTLEILKAHGIPFVDGPVDDAELATPTGCAILAALRPDFKGLQDPSKLVTIGCGAGTKSFPNIPNILRLQLLETTRAENTVEGAMASAIAQSPLKLSSGEVIKVTMVIDDATPEDVGSLIEKSYKLGAKECYSLPASMKKHRLGMEVNVLCDVTTVQSIIALWMEESTTLGCRVERALRVVVDREIKNFHVDLSNKEKMFSGDVHVKVIGIKPEFANIKSTPRPRFKIEHDDLKEIAEKLDISLHQARELVEAKIAGKSDEFGE
nr:LarC family nickel insertion protein [Candidatus Sigynarchaeota archaeon]